MEKRAHEHLVLSLSMYAEVEGSMQGLAQRVLGQLHRTCSGYAMQMWVTEAHCLTKFSPFPVL